MLNFIYGRAATGKTTKMLSVIEKQVKAGEKVIYIVPEQFSFESERQVLNILGDKLSHNVSVLSFTSLADTLTRLCGGGARGLLNDADKILFMNKALLSLKDELYIWQRFLAYPGFASKVVDMIGEFKVSAIFPEDLDIVADKLNESALKEKIKALALVYRAYDAMLYGRFIDPADKLDKLYNDLKNNGFFKNKVVFIDGFKGFTGQQYKVLDIILSTAKSLTVTVLSDNIEEEDGIFENTTAAVKRIIKLAQRHHVKLAENIYLNEPHYQSEDMCCVEAILSGNKMNSDISGKNLSVCIAKSVDDEVRFVARNIRRLVRENPNNYRYKDFVIIARNPEHYEAAIEREFELHGISCFFDKRVPLTLSPIFAFIDSALNSVSYFDSEEIFRFVKTGLSSDMSIEEICDIENYVYLWDISAGGWNEKWDMDPTGFSETDQNKNEEIKAELLRLNALKEKAIAPIVKLRREFGETVKEKATAIINMLDFCGAEKKMSDILAYMKKDFSPEDIDAFRQSWDSIMNVLDGIVRCFGEDTVTLEQFKNMFRISCEMTTVGRVPQMLDEVTFGAADRIRPSRPKVAFILGANQGVFPKMPENNSILGNSDRSILFDNGLQIRNKTSFQAIEENLLVYSCACCPSDMLFISCNQTGADGNSNEPSAFFEQLAKAVGKEKVVYEPLETLEKANLPETAESAFRTLCDFASRNRKETETLKVAVFLDADKKQKFLDIENASKGYEPKLSSHKAKELYGNNIKMSATKFDSFHSCRFKFFCQYGLNTKVIQPAKLDSMQRGLIVHYVLEKFCNAHLQNIADVAKSAIVPEVDKYIKEYFSLIRGSEFLFTARFKFLVKKIAEGLYEIVERIVDEFSKSEFRPEKCEVKIEPGGAIPEVVFPFGKDGKLLFKGSIDRVDVWENINGKKAQSYVRIIDYKTGGKSFRLSETLYGLNLQMLIYLYCVIRGENAYYNSKKPAGILYLPSKKDINKTGLAMNGIICENKEVREAMEKDNKGVYIPEYKYTKNGKPSKNNTSYISEESFNTIFDYIEEIVSKTGEEIHSGSISVNPIESSSKSPCVYCNYKTVCGNEDSECRKIEKISNDTVFEEMRGGGNSEA